MTTEPLPDEYAKWAYLHARPPLDALDRRIQARACALWAAAGERPAAFVHLAAALARDAIHFQTDTARVGSEHLGHPADALERGTDDCDAKARLFVALCLAVGLRAELVPRWTPDGQRLQHVYAAVQLAGRWQPVELTLSRARVGDEPLSVPKEASGTWRTT